MYRIATEISYNIYYPCYYNFVLKYRDINKSYEEFLLLVRNNFKRDSCRLLMGSTYLLNAFSIKSDEH